MGWLFCPEAIAIRAMGAAAPHSGKPIIFGQKPVSKNEKLYLLNEKTEFIPSSEIVSEIRDFY